MKFPVDLLAHVSQEELERSAQNYMNTLLYSNPDFPESITLSDSTEVIINISTVGFVPIYGSSDKQKILALFTSTDPFTAVALYLLNRWWTISDILKTEDNERNGAVEVQTVGERIVLYSLNRVIYRAKEMSSEELPFLCHGETDYAKILWHNGEAVGFYSVKLSGSLCSSFSTRSYQLPVMDSIYVRKCHRGYGYGLQMLKDYVLSFNDSCLGLRYPLATAMYKVCQKYLSQYPGDADLLWEVQSIGGPNQRTNIANKIQVMDLSVSKRLLYTEEPVVIMEEREKDTTTMIKEADSVKCTVEILEEVIVVKEAVPVAAWDRSNGSKQWKVGENITEDKTEKVIRIEDIEAESPGEEQVQEQQITEEHNISEHEDMLSVTTEVKPEVEAGKDSASMLDKTTTVQALKDLESESTVAPAAEECQVEDKDLCTLNALCDSQIAIENVVSEIEEAHKKDLTVVSGEVLDMCKEAEMVEMVWQAKNDPCEEELDEIVIQQVKRQSTHATSAKEKAEKSGQAVVKTDHNEPPQLRSQRMAEEDGGRALRGRIVGSLASKCESTQQSQKVGEKLESELSSAKEVDELARTEGEYGSFLTTAPEVGEVVIENNKTNQEQKNKEVERSLEDEAKECDEEKELPVVQRRALRARSKAIPSCKSTRHSKRHQKQQDEHTDNPESQEFVREESIEQQMEKEDTINKPQKDIPSIEISYVGNNLELTLSTEENMEECKEVQEEGKTPELIDTEAVVEEGKEEAEAGTVIADETEKFDSFGDAGEAREQNLPSVESANRTEEPYKKSAGNSGIPKFHDSAVMLVDMKAACHHHHQVMNTEEIQATKVTAAENEKMILTKAGASEKDRISVVEQKVLEPQQGEKVVEEEATEGDYGKDMENDREFEEKQCLFSDTSADKYCTVQNAQQSTPLAEDNEVIRLDKKEVPLVQTRALRSGTITIIDIPGHNTIRKTQDQLSEVQKTHQKTKEKAKEEIVEGGEACFEPDVEFQQEKGVAGEANSEQNIAKQQSVAITEKVADKLLDVSGDKLQDGKDVEEKTMTGSGQENATTVADDSKGGAPKNQNETVAEDEKILTVEAEQSEIVALQMADLPRLSVVLVDLKKTQHGVQADTDVELEQEETTTEISVPGSFAVIAETRQGTKEKEASVVTTHDLHDEKTPKAKHDDQDMEEEKSTEAKETRLLRGGIKSTSATPRRKSIRALTQPKIEENFETKEAEPLAYTETEETIAEETQDNQREKMEEKEETESTTQKEESEAHLETVENIVQESVSERGASKDTVKGTVADESLDNIQTTDKVQAADEDEAPAAKTTFLKSDQKTMKAAQDEEEEEEKGSEEGKPVIETRVLRSGKKCTVTISRRISSRICTQSQTEEDDAEEGTAPIIKTQLEEAISKETQDNQEEMTDTEKADAVRADKESETEVGKDAVAEESLPEQGTVEETPPTQSVEHQPATEEANTTNEEYIADAEGEKNTEEDESAKRTRVLRHERKSASVTPRHKSKRSRKQLETEEDEVGKDTAPTKKISLEGGISKEIQEEKTEGSEKAVAATHKEDTKEREIKIQNQAVVAEESLPEQGPVEETPAIPSVEDLPTTEVAKATNEEEIPVLARRVLSSGQKTVKATQDEQDTDTEEDELAKETKVLRCGRTSVSATPRCKSRRAHTHPQTEEKEVREYIASAEEMQVEETSDEETQDNQEEKKEEKEEIESATQKEDNKDSEADIEIVQNLVEESVSEQGASKDSVKGTVADESLDHIQTTDKVQATDEKVPPTKTTLLVSDQKTMNTTQDEEEEEEKDTEDGKPVVETRVLRSGKKCAVTISRRTSRRTCTQSQTEEDDVEEGTVPIKKIQLEEAIYKETQDNQEQTAEDSEKADAPRAGNKESETAVEKEAVAGETLPEQGTEEETLLTQSIEELTTEEANATNEENIVDTEESKTTEEHEPAKETRVLRSLRKSASATPRHKSKRECKHPQTKEKVETEIVAPFEYMHIEETIDEETQDNQEENTEDRLKDKTTTQKEDDRESETEEAVAKSIPKKDQIEEQEDETNKEENILIKMTDTETSNEKRDDLDLEVDADEEIETVSLNREKEDEQSLSEDEQIVIRGKVLRGRSVPSIIITPKSRYHSAKVQKTKEPSSYEDLEHKPKRRQSAKRSCQKRQSSEMTPNRRTKRHRI